jgi:hypothetical protein
VYDVTISRHPHCSCPDHAKGNLCKHILFVMLRVLKLSTTNPLVWQKALLTKEVRHGIADMLRYVCCIFAVVKCVCSSCPPPTRWSGRRRC